MRSIDFSSWWGMPAYNLLNSSYAGAGLYAGVDALGAYRQQKSAAQKYADTVARLNSYPSGTTYTKTGGADRVTSYDTPGTSDKGTTSGGYTPGYSGSDVSKRTEAALTQTLTNEGAKAALRAAVPTALGVAMRAPGSTIANTAVGSAFGPGAIFGAMGNLVNSQLGIAPSVPGSLATTGLTTLGSLALGPAGAMIGGLFGGVVGDLAADGLNIRTNEVMKDTLENEFGWADGHTRSAYATSVLGDYGVTNAVDSAIKNQDFNVSGYSRNINPDAMIGMVATQDAMNQARSEALSRENWSQVKAARENAIADAVSRGWTTGMVPGGWDPMKNPYAPIGINMDKVSRDSAAKSGDRTYGGWGSIGGPAGGARAADPSYGENMGGFAGLGIGNPSTYGGSTGGGRDGGSQGYGGGNTGGNNSGGQQGGKDGNGEGYGGR